MAELGHRYANKVVALKGRSISGPGPNRLLMFQEAALFPWMTVLGNLKFALAARGVPRAEAAEPGIGKLEVKQFNAGPAAAEGGGQILVDERDLWPNRRFPTTVLVATKKALETRRPQLAALLRVHMRLTERWRTEPEAFTSAVNNAFGKLTSKPLAPAILEEAFSRLEPALDPEQAAMAEAARHAKELGYLPTDDISGLVDLSLLNELRATPQ
jgi:ABC-type sugar transport system ATPase subunit